MYRVILETEDGTEHVFIKGVSRLTAIDYVESIADVYNELYDDACQNSKLLGVFLPTVKMVSGAGEVYLQSKKIGRIYCEEISVIQDHFHVR